MIGRNTVRERLKAGVPTVGCFTGLKSATAAEMLGSVGFEWIAIEAEHNGLSLSEVEKMVMALGSCESVPLVRVPSQDRVYIQGALDLGAFGVIVPGVRTAGEADAIVRATRYPPEGDRGFGPFRAGRYTAQQEEYFQTAAQHILVVLMLETREAVENLEAIASVPGIDALYIGPFDLCLALGLDPFQQPHHQIEEVCCHALDIGKRTGVAIGRNVRTPDAVRTRLRQGFTMIGYGPDYTLLVAAAKEGIAAFAATADTLGQ